MPAAGEKETTFAKEAGAASRWMHSLRRAVAATSCAGDENILRKRLRWRL